MSWSSVLSLAIAGFGISEIAVAVVRRSSRETADTQDRGSMAILWFLIMLGIFGAFAAQRIPLAQIPVAMSVLAPVALLVLVAGLVIRWAAILTLGRFFTVDVAIAKEHRVVREGLYRHVRHPSYSGLLVAFLGMGIGLHSWLSVAILLVPVTIGLLIRIRVEERALRAALGREYEEYCEKTWRLVPGVF